MTTFSFWGGVSLQFREKKSELQYVFLSVLRGNCGNCVLYTQNCEM